MNTATDTITSTDRHSFAKPAESVVKHLTLNATIDFVGHRISGVAEWDIENKSNGTSIIFDTRGLKIEKVLLDDSSEEAKFILGAPMKYLGSPLAITIKPETKKVRIFYSTGKEADALQWLEAEQTAGKKHPFLFTQSQAILARTWVPCQDSPGIRFTYDATISLPKGMMALMSAENPQKTSADGVYHFRMPNPIPSYLMALAAGDLVFMPIGERSGVYAEPVSIDKAVYEFADLDKMLVTAEKLYGAYAWGRYDLIVLPPSFPFGGMENPRLTFCTPTIIAGDRSLTSLVAHELAHSWSGNLVTNATWDDFWLNEGFTMFFENRIMEALYGKPFSDMQALLGLEELQSTIKEMGDTSADTHLKLNLTGRDPDDGMNAIAYIKGQYLLKLLEAKFGRERIDAFLNGYFSRHSFGTITTEQFLKEYHSELVKGDSAIAKEIDIDTWIFGPGLPSNCPTIKSELFEHVDAQIAAWKTGTPSEKLSTKSFSTNEWLRFLRGLPEKIASDRMIELDHSFHFTQSGNSEILAAWFEHVIQNRYEPGFAALDKFLLVTGRRKFCKPLYALLTATPEGLEQGRAIFARAKRNYHPITRATIEEILYSKAN